jgi:hypothetical protein
MGKKKEKITYIDDGRTIADMSGVGGPRLGKRHPASLRPKGKDVWNTYWGAVKMMFVPMLVVITALIVIYMILAAIFMFL